MINLAIYLIDFENVTSAGISGIQKLTKDDKVYIFYTVNASNMSFAAHMNLLSSPAEVIYYNVTSGGKNALDFQLSSFLGYLISRGEDKNFCIISNDRGYDHVKSFWEKSGLASGITINSAPSINRSLLPMERPFTSKIQQNTQQNSVTPEQLKAEANKYVEQKAAKTETEVAAAENVGFKTEAAEMPDVKPETDKNSKSAEVSAEKPAKRRGRPAGKKSENEAAKTANAENVKETAKPDAKTPANAEAVQNKPKVQKNAKNVGSEKSANCNATNKNAKAVNKPVKSGSSANEDIVSKSIKNTAAKAGISSEKEISEILALLRSADGKQQFYRGLLKIFGMERGVEVYKAVRPEYTNLTKLVKQ